MRLIPFITAILVTAGLYLAVFEREKLLALAMGDSAAAQEGAESDVPQETAEAVAQASETAVGVVALKSVARQIDSAVVLRGQTRAIRQVEVRAETSAIVVSEPKRKGAFVEEGDLLCQLDTGTRDAVLAEMRARKLEAESRVPEAQARLEEAKARLLEAEINNNAAQKLSEGGYASETRRVATEAAVSSAQAGIESAKSGLEATKAGIEAASAAVAAAEREIARLSINAPFRGLLESDTAEIGSLMQPGTLCATVIQLNPIKVVGFVPETEVNRVTVGSLAGARLATGLEVQGRVTFLSRSADPTTRTFEVEITVANDELLIRDGQTATIGIASDGTLAHLLPQSSLTLNNDGQLGVRAVGSDNIVQFHPVTLIKDQADGVWVTGLSERTDVIVVGQEFVTQGVRVVPTYEEAAK